MGLIAALKEKGYDPKKLQAIFENKKLGKETKGDLALTQKLIERHRGLIRDGLDQNWQSARHWRAIDDAYDAGQEQITVSIMRGLIGKKPDSEEVLSAIKHWKLDSMLTWTGEGVNRKAVLDLPIFFNIFVPLTAAYTKVRWAKLWTDRDTVPLYKYSPTSSTVEAKLACQVVTDQVAFAAETMQYRVIEREVILPALLYSYAWTMPRSDCVVEKSLWKGKGAVEEYITREGIDWMVVHPAKSFFDRSYPLSSINADCGIRWFGNWTVVAFSSIENNEAYWNKDTISVYSGEQANTWVRPSEWKVYQQFYPCTLKMPDCWSNELSNSRDAVYYNQSITDHGVQIINFFDKLVPSQYGLYACDTPVWHHFIYAGDGTVIHCVPVAYTPGTVDLYDYDTNRARNTSLAQELLPFQDHISNLLTQYLLSVKQNLANLTFVDQRQIPPETIDKVENLAKSSYVGMNLIRYNRLDFDQMGATATQAITPLAFPKHNTQEIVQAINTTISIAERMLGFSPQEIGAAASHEQSATEVAVISQGTSTRLALTGSFIDDGRSARQKRAYDAWLEYSEREISQTLSGMQPLHIKALKDMGFTVTETPGTDLVKIEGSRELVDIDSFTQTRAPQDRFNDSKVAIAMIQAIQMLMSNQLIVERFGVDFFVRRFNEILEFSGVPGDWRFDLDNAKGAQPSQQQMMQQVTQFIEQALQKNNQAITGELQQVINSTGEHFKQTDQQVSSLAQATGGKLQEQQQILAALLDQVRGIIQPQFSPQTAVVPAPPVELPPPPEPALNPPVGQPVAPV